jgi:hypothetical protein
MMAILPEELTERVKNAVREIHRSIMPARVPDFLYHHTRGIGFEGIVKSRALRASCAANLSDEWEITHGAELLAGIIERRLAYRNTLHNFTKLVLARLKSMPLERKNKTYVACFCERGDAARQWEEYGPYCLRFPIYKDGTPGLRPRISRASIQFVKATYKNRLKHSYLATLVGRVVEALGDRTIVDWDTNGPWTTSIVDQATFWISELALDVLVSFKSDKFQWEHEWRLVIKPSQVIPGSDRLLPDQAFNVMVIKGDNGKRHIELLAREPDRDLLMPSGRPPVPFDLVTIGPFKEPETCRLLARRLLEDECFDDIPVQLSKPKWWSRVRWTAT